MIATSTIATTISMSVKPRAPSGKRLWRIRRIAQSIALQAHTNAGGAGDRDRDPQSVRGRCYVRQFASRNDCDGNRCGVASKTADCRAIDTFDVRPRHVETIVVIDIVEGRRRITGLAELEADHFINAAAAAGACSGRIDIWIVRIAIGKGAQ